MTAASLNCVVRYHAQLGRADRVVGHAWWRPPVAGGRTLRVLCRLERHLRLYLLTPGSATRNSCYFRACSFLSHRALDLVSRGGCSLTPVSNRDVGQQGCGPISLTHQLTSLTHQLTSLTHQLTSLDSYPPADVSYPPADVSYPPADVSYPPADVSYPPADVSYPPADVAYPPADVSYPPVYQTPSVAMQADVYGARDRCLRQRACASVRGCMQAVLRYVVINVNLVCEITFWSEITF